MRLPFQPPLDWSAFREFLGARSLSGVESFEGDTYRRSFHVYGVSGTLEVSPLAGGDALELRIDADVGDTGRAGELDAELAARVRRLFDLDADPRSVADVLSRDPRLRAAVARRPGLRVPGAFEPFETAVRAILGQQVSVAAATTIAGRLVSRFGAPLARPNGAVTHVAPSAAAIAAGDLSSLGVPQKRVDAIRHLAREVAAGRHRFVRAASVEETVAGLCELPGFGPWTAHYVAMRACGERDAFPAGDLGVRRALGAEGALAREVDCVHRSDRWRPFRAYAVMHLWMNLPATGRKASPARNGSRRR